MDLSQASVQNRIGAIFFVVVNQTFGTVMPTVTVLPLQRSLIRRERAAGTYRASTSYVAKWLSGLPLTLLSALVLAIPIYWMFGLQADLSRFLTFLAVLLVHSWAGNTLGLMIGSGVPNVAVGQILAPLIVVIFLIFGGQLVNLDAMPVVFKWIQWISIVSYTNKALNQNEFQGLKFDCQPFQCLYRDGEQVLELFHFDNVSIWNSVLAVAGLGLSFFFTGYFLFRLNSKPLLRLK